MYKRQVSVDLSKYFDTLNHELLMNLLHRTIQDMRVLRIIKKYLKSGVMENGVVSKTAVSYTHLHGGVRGRLSYLGEPPTRLPL